MAAVLDPPMGAVSTRSSAAAFGLKPRKSEEDDLGRLRAKSSRRGALADRSRSNRSTVLISFSQGVSRNQALAGNTVNSRVSQRLRPVVSVLADPLGLRPGYAQFKPAAQAGLVILDLGQQVIARGDHALERFFGRVRRRA